MSYSFIFDNSINESLKSVDDATYRMMMNAIIQYCVDGTEPELNGLEAGLFISWKATVDILNSQEESQEKTENRKESQIKSQVIFAESQEIARNRKESQEKSQSESQEKERKEENEEKERSKEKEEKEEKKDKEYLNIYGDNPKKQAEELFNELWRIYPRKEGKGSVSQKQKLRLLKVGRDQMIRCVERFLEAKKNTDKQYLPYGSTFFNSGYIDYLDENFNKPLEKPPDTTPDDEEELVGDDW